MTWRVGCRLWWDGLEDGIEISFLFPNLSFWPGKSRFVVSKAYNLLEKQLWERFAEKVTVVFFLDCHAQCYGWLKHYLGMRKHHLRIVSLGSQTFDTANVVEAGVWAFRLTLNNIFSTLILGHGEV